MNIFRRWIAPKVEQDADDSQNPWAGLAPYEDPETAERKLKFCGRDDEKYDVEKLIMCNTFITLYGKSGIGKTSLLNAGVFPDLRKERYTPVSLRLGMRDVPPQSFQSIIIDAIEQKISRYETINVIDEQTNEQAVDYLWNYFARHRFYDRFDEPTTPVIVLDQFEEVFRNDRKDAEMLLRQLDYLNDKDHTIDSCADEDHFYRYEQNFRFVVSIREDDLYLLEDSIDNCYLPALKRCRYRLRSLSEQGAMDAICIPGEKNFSSEEKEKIARAVIEIARNKEDQGISTNLLSLVSNRLYIESQKMGSKTISLPLVDSFVKSNPFERFYNEVTSGLSNSERNFLEKNLVDEFERRKRIPEESYKSNIKNSNYLLEGDTRILQRVGNNPECVELIHDCFCPIIINQKNKRIPKTLLNIHTLFIFYFWYFAVNTFLFGCLAFYQHPQWIHGILVILISLSVYISYKISKINYGTLKPNLNLGTLQLKKYYITIIFLDFLEIFALSHLSSILYNNWSAWSALEKPISARYSFYYYIGERMTTQTFCQKDWFSSHLLFYSIVHIVVLSFFLLCNTNLQMNKWVNRVSWSKVFTFFLILYVFIDIIYNLKDKPWL